MDGDAQAWKAAIAALYEATWGDRPRGPVEGCPCCVSAGEARALHQVARESAPGEAIGRFAFKAMTTWGEPRDFRWFLPRILELMATEQVGALSLELVAGKILSAGFAAWPAPEREVVRAAFAALFRLRLGGGASVEVTDLAASCALLGVDLRPLLEELALRALDDAAAAEVYIELADSVVCRQGDPAVGGIHGRAAAAEAALTSFFWSEPALAQVEQLFFRFPEGRLGERLSLVAQCLELARDAGRLPGASR
ncbi:uncharacterized protein SOCE26_013870 [Sorangium cellulosum]|uniref:Uncharacterized protein n=1 Tax=Sorangium cellulosum TaxID=56 RepID=A0A2L0EL55_SORCE|nr:hypothetical protein [Sorangium cellulosum]AUX39992.1 uncharacterized protein SOCE26_013870 [Sorangium cellulosum]